jgi:DNA uptake protein ComE-like DNA-binding protein
MIKFFRKAREFFAFSKGDRDAVIALAILILITGTFHIVLKFAINSTPADHSRFESSVNGWLALCDTTQTMNTCLFEFDPNTVSGSQLESLPLPKKVKNNLLKYRAAGGRLYKPGDLKKIYGMNDSILGKVKEYIKFENIGDSNDYIKDHFIKHSEKDSSTFPATVSDSVLSIVELNSADSLQLVRLRGIGPVFAARIIRFRNLLGGFYSKNQLLEVYNFPEETFYQIRRYITVDASVVKKIRINYAGYSELIRHPYLEKADILKILDYREKHGAFSSTEQVLKLNFTDSLKKEKVIHYLTCR